MSREGGSSSGGGNPVSNSNNHEESKGILITDTEDSKNNITPSPKNIKN